MSNKVYTVQNEELKKKVHEMSTDMLESCYIELVEEENLLENFSQVHSCLISSLSGMFQTLYGDEAYLELLKAQISLLTLNSSEDISS